MRRSSEQAMARSGAGGVESQTNRPTESVGLLRWERWALAHRGWARVGGVDEAGRGPLAGPVVAACVVLPVQALDELMEGALRGLTDSKQLSAARREAYFGALGADARIEVGVGQCSVEEIDRINILRATWLAMARAVQALDGLPDGVLIDGLPVQGMPCPHHAIVKGDAASLSIAAASVVAKVTRDRTMAELDRRYPAYGFARHKGYGTQAHLEALRQEGPCPEHRRTFAPVAAVGAMKPDEPRACAPRGAER